MRTRLDFSAPTISTSFDFHDLVKGKVDVYRFISKHRSTRSDCYVLFCHDHLSHPAIVASSYMKLMHTRSSGSSTTLIRHISPVSQERF